MSAGLPLRLRLALGTRLQVGDECPATGGVRQFDALLPGATGRPTHRLILCPPPPDGPTPAHLAERLGAIQGISHAGLAPLAAFGAFEGRAWFAEQTATAPSLAARIATRGVVSTREAVTVLRELARVLAVLHRAGIAHGGLATDAVHFSADGGVVLANGWCEGSFAADLNALGLIGVHLLTGRQPSVGATHPLANHRGKIPAELRELLEQLGDPDRAGRRPRAEDVLRVLDAYPDHAPSPLDTLFEEAGRGARRADRHPALLVVVLASLGLLALILLQSTP